MHDVIVVGAGCVGSYVAGLLAERGHDVVVLDKDREVGDSVNCSGIVGTEAFSSLGLPSETIQGEVRELSVFGPSGRSVVYSPPEPMAYVVDRVGFDRRLAEMARRRGVAYTLSTQVEDVEADADSVRLTVRSEGEESSLRGKVCILATGFGAKIVQKVGLGKISDWVQGVQLEAEVAEVERTEIHLGREVAPGSFAWVIPVGRDWCKIGLLAEQSGGDLIRRFIEGPRLAGRLRSWDGTIKASLIPTRPVPRSVSHRLLAVGEAAGQVKVTTSGGIYYGFLCAQIAVDVLSRAFETDDFGAEALSVYDARWRAKLGREQKLGRSLLRIFSKMSDRHIDAFIELTRVDGVIPLVDRLFRFDWHAPLISALLKNQLKDWA